MRDEWNEPNTISTAAAAKAADSYSSQGLTRVGGQIESSKAATSRGGLDRSASLTLAHKSMRLKSKAGVGREVSERRQVGDAETLVNQQNSMDEPVQGRAPWWRNVGMEEGL